jgi:hypothetical protein
VLIVGYWASLIAVGSDPEGGWARAASLFPATAPFAMPGRIALGAAPWWEPVLAVALTLAAIAGLVVLAGRVYAGAILHAGPTLRLRDAWGRSSIALHTPTSTPVEHAATGGISRGTNALIIGIGVALGVTAFVLADDFVMAVAIGAGFYAVASRMVKARDRAQDRGAPPLSPGRAPWPGHRAPGRRGSAPGRARP